MFNGCSSLRNITMIGIINKGVSFANSSKLTNASVQSIIDALADLTGTTAQTLTLHSTVVDSMTEAQADTIYRKNWTLG